MAPDRRVAACLLLLVAAVPLLLAQLPQHVEVVLGPMAAVLVASALILTPTPRWIVVGSWIPVALLLVGCARWSTPMESWALIALLPIGLMALEQRLLTTLLTTTVGVAVFVGIGGLAPSNALAPFSVRHPSDIVGVLACAGALLWLVVDALRFRLNRHRICLQRETAQHLEHAIARDLRWLDSIASTVADPSLKGPVRNPGVNSEQLALAARIDSDTVLLGWIEGPVLATLSVGWGLCAAARAGMRSPHELLTFGRTRFDEMVDPSAIRWLALWDRRRGQLLTAGSSNPGSLSRYMLTAHGPTAIGPKVHGDTLRAVRELLDEYDATSLVEHTMLVTRAPVVVGLGLAATALAIAFLPLPGPTWMVSMLAFTVGHALIDHAGRRSDALESDVAGTLRDRTEAHDDLRFQIARRHGSLLEYHIETGDFGATAHRLQGEVLDGSFADMLVGSRGQGLIFAGEVAGRGIAARFLGFAAQIITRALLDQGLAETSPGNLIAQVNHRLRGFGQALRFPVRLRMGLATCSPQGLCSAWGSLRNFVLTTGGMKTSPVRTALVHEARLDTDSRLYVTPSTSLPGPEDDAPALVQRQAAERVARVLKGASGRAPGPSSLPSLFSLVFDGVHAPAYGMIIEIAALRREEKGDRSADQGDANPPQHSESATAASR